MRPPSAAVEQARAQTKIEDRLRRLEGKLQTMGVQLSVLREQARGPAEAATSADRRGPGSHAAQRRPLRADVTASDSTAHSLGWPQGQRIVTDAAGRVHLVAVAEAEGEAPGADTSGDAAALQQPASDASAGDGGPAAQRAARSRRSPRNRAN